MDRSCEDRGPGPSILLEQGPEKTVVLGPVRTNIGPNQDVTCRPKIYLSLDIIFIQFG